MNVAMALRGKAYVLRAIGAPDQAAALDEEADALTSPRPGAVVPDPAASS